VWVFKKLSLALLPVSIPLLLPTQIQCSWDIESSMESMSYPFPPEVAIIHFHLLCLCPSLPLKLAVTQIDVAQRVQPPQPVTTVHIFCVCVCVHVYPRNF
jgi:hypothetical protein